MASFTAGFGAAAQPMNDADVRAAIQGCWERQIWDRKRQILEIDPLAVIDHRVCFDDRGQVTLYTVEGTTSTYVDADGNERSFGVDGWSEGMLYSIEGSVIHFRVENPPDMDQLAGRCDLLFKDFDHFAWDNCSAWVEGSDRPWNPALLEESAYERRDLGE